MDLGKALLPETHQLPNLLELLEIQEVQQVQQVQGSGKSCVSDARFVPELISEVLLQPIDDFLNRPAKKFRGLLVELGYLLSGNNAEPTAEVLRIRETYAQVIESLHAGSLIVDDIQDGSKVRRGKPSLHVQKGMPVALNAANWLYFWPMQKIKALGLNATQELQIYHLVHEVMLRAHFGQSLDVGVRIDTVAQHHVHALCMASLELKSGALMALGLCLGAAAGGATESRMTLLGDFGRRFGTALQMFDDIGNLASPEPECPSGSPFEYTKRHEDLLLKRPSWIWAVAASSLPDYEYQQFVSAVERLPNESFLNPWLENHAFIPLARRKAKEYLEQALNGLETALGPSNVMHRVREIADTVANSYG